MFGKYNEVSVEEQSTVLPNPEPGDIYVLGDWSSNEKECYILAQVDDEKSYFAYNLISLQNGNRFTRNYYSIDELLVYVQSRRTLVRRVAQCGNCEIIIKVKG